jgi:hypothetical protein
MLCDHGADNLTQHLKYAHNHRDIKKYYDLYLKKCGEDICKLKGCNNLTTFSSLKKGYLDYCSPKCAATANSNKAKQTRIKKYGINYVSKILEKIKHTKLLKYGDSNYNNHKKISKSLSNRSNKEYKIWKNKVKDAWKNKNEKELIEILNKRNKTFFKKYGKNFVEHAIEQINIFTQKNNVSNVSQIPKIRKKITESLNKLYSDPKKKNEVLMKSENTCMKNYGCKNIFLHPIRKIEMLKKARLTREKNGNCLPQVLMKTFEKYRNRVHALTNKNKFLKFTDDELKKIGKMGNENAFQIDHMVSIKEGFLKNVPIKIISDPKNLRLIHWKENLNKRDKSCISITELYSRINENN